LSAIPLDVAMRLCEEVQEEKGVRLFSQCWGCLKFSKGDPAKRCFVNGLDNRGCRFVNARYDER
jgi:hypothetical protein